jgi:hypothetical protein
MLIIGNLKIDETNPARVHFFFATLLSYAIFSEQGIGITLNECSDDLFNKTKQLLKDNFAKFDLIKFFGPNPFWDGIKVHNPWERKYYIHFEEDHFCMLTTNDILYNINIEFYDRKFDIIRASFNEIEKRSAEEITGEYKNQFKTFRMTKENHDTFCKPYGYRYFIGTNNIIRTSFAERLYKRKHGFKPHDFEMSKYEQEYEYTCSIPSVKIMQAIDDDHGEQGTSLLSRPTPKFKQCMDAAKKYI